MMSAVVISKRPSCLYWSKIEKWTPTSRFLRFDKTPFGWRLLPVYKFATQVDNKERVKPDAEYRMAGVKWYGGGVFNRETVLGKEQSANYLHPLKPGSIIYNRLFAWKESFATVPEDFAGLYVSNEFPQFEINKAVALPEYVFLLFTSKQIINAVNAASIGSAAISRNRFKEVDFLSFKVPIPPVPVQQKIVAYWKAAEASIREAEILLEKTRKKAFDSFRNALGLSTTMSVNKPRLFTANWRQIDRWGIDLVWRNKNDTNSFVFPTKLLRLICKTGAGGTPSRKHKEYFGGNILWVKTAEVKNNVINDTEEKITQLGLASSSAKLFPAGSIIVAMYGQGATRGRTAKLGVAASTNQACLVITEIDDSLDSDFLWYYLIVSYEAMRSLASGNNQPNLSAELIGGFPVPIPPKEKQKELKELFEKAQIEVSRLQSHKGEIRERTAKEIEKLILGLRPVEDI